MGGVGPVFPNTSIPVIDIHSRICVSLGASNINNQVGPILSQDARDSQIEKKRRRKDKWQDPRMQCNGDM